MRAGTQEGGFSLIELMVAMAITLVVSGAIYGLLTAGNNAFRREPELADRQQNIRMAMDLISRDVEEAGNGMIPFVQAFTNNLDGVGPPGPGGVNTDYLEIVLNDGTCPTLAVAGSPGTALHTTAVLPACLANAASNGFLAYVWGANGPANSGLSSGILFIHTPGGGKAGGPCGGGTLNTPHGGGGGQVNLPGIQGCGGGTACSTSGLCQNVAMIQVVRYEIAPDPDDPTTPALWRSPAGTTLGGLLNNNQPPNPPWQVVARGIEDLQVRYLTGNGWADLPGNVAGAYGNIVREVQISLSGRSTAQNLQGQTTSALVGVGQNAVRGQLVSIVSPRAALLAVQQGGLWR
jgi:prepilin-type N-terminal cleavage/methylation domain-containing protein